MLPRQTTNGHVHSDVMEYHHNHIRETEEAKHLEVIQVLSLLALLVQKYKY